MSAFRPDNCLILSVDDLPQNLQALGSLLDNAGYATTFASSGQQAIDRARSARPDLILLDLMMPGMNGLQTCFALQEDPQTREIPIIFITANPDREHLLAAFAAGAVDYVTKPFEVRELLARVKTHLELKHAKDELKRALAQVERLAATDALTGLFNRRYLCAAGDQEFHRARHENAPFCVLLLDLDRFKQINDTYGHAVGDEVLRSTARCLLQSLRPSDIAGRFGGEEFLAILPATLVRQALPLAHYLRHAITIAAEVAIGITGVTASFGVAAYRCGDDSFEALVKRADRALYRAKDRGRNCVCTSIHCSPIVPAVPQTVAKDDLSSILPRVR